MTRHKNLLLLSGIHIVVLTAIVVLVGNMIDDKRALAIEGLSQQLEGVVQTISGVGVEGPISRLSDSFHRGTAIESSHSDYVMASAMYKDILMANGLTHSEMSFLVAGQNGNLHRLASSELIYSFGEAFNSDRFEYLEAHSGTTELVEITSSIHRLVSFKTIKDLDGNVGGVIRVESENVKSHFAGLDSFWPYFIPISLYILLVALVKPYFVRYAKNLRMNKINVAIHEELKKKNTELKMLSLVAKKSENLMLITDKEGQILWVNETYEMKNNYTAEELNEFVGQYLQNVSKNEHINTIIKNVVDFKKAFTYESHSVGPDGKDYHAMTTVSPVINDSKAVTNLLFVDADVTVLKQAQKENEVYREFVMKSRFPRMHVTTSGLIKLSNPASAAILENWLMKDGKIKEDIQAMLSGICDSGVVENLKLSVGDIEYVLDFIPDQEKKELFVIGQSATLTKHQRIDPADEKRAG